MADFVMQPGWVTVSELEQRINSRSLENPAFQRNIRALRLAFGEFTNWPLHLRKDLFAKLEITAIVMVVGPEGVIGGP